jgi:hypothetical protein
MWTVAAGAQNAHTPKSEPAASPAPKSVFTFVGAQIRGLEARHNPGPGAGVRGYPDCRSQWNVLGRAFRPADGSGGRTPSRRYLRSRAIRPGRNASADQIAQSIGSVGCLQPPALRSVAMPGTHGREVSTRYRVEDTGTWWDDRVLGARAERAGGDTLSGSNWRPRLGVSCV